MAIQFKFKGDDGETNYVDENNVIVARDFAGAYLMFRDIQVAKSSVGPVLDILEKSVAAPADGLIEKNLNGVEEWREYDFGGRVYRIDNPVTLWFRRGGETHRVLGADGITHCVPAPGVNGCALRWLGKVQPVNF